ncbi:uncharacterized protein EV422DRAFT_565344 [Fimicolochytrium jonesii]|uniref:uncharacterized protein n=1 Tax=Fimicolochytrium jonesii TaxID=1396493 RepID=UPI0022FEE201|nr:uncharacterized protein EV422DRAFT_565344 [Fimicolochytrium jonesii]KAI8823394.1 hypothetical protein EV422DRAFT_565344 [Fimicolochytrium jonesii]
MINQYPEESRTTCMCCANLLKFPGNVPCFSEMHSVTDLVPIRPPPPQPGGTGNGATFTLPTIRDLLSNPELTREQIDNAIYQLFSRHYSLNESFLNGRTTNVDDSGVALDDVREVYQLIARNGVAAQRAMIAGIDELLRRPGRQLQQPEDIRFLIILVENPLFLKPPPDLEQSYVHSVVSRLLGLLSCLPNDLHHHLVVWLNKVPTAVFGQRVTLVNYFISYRLAQIEGMRENYPTDWPIRSAARFMALLHATNGRRADPLPMAELYNTLVDYVDLYRDFKIWQEDRTGAFSFCQYPFLVSLGGKMQAEAQIMEADAKRQMAERFKEAFYRTALHGLVTDPFLSLHIRRNNLIEDSLNQLQSRHFDLKKKLRIEFMNEDGVDAGGLTKEWFLLLVRDLFDPQYGMFIYEEDSNLCWFNPASFENTEEFRLVGIILGLAIHNSNILDIHFPLACYKKLLDQPTDIEDLKILRPTLTRGLQHLLEYTSPDVETTFCRDFVAEYEAFGQTIRVPLIPNGENTPVTNLNRTEFVEKYVSWALNESIETQFSAFKAGFKYVCGGNALSLFSPQEIELMVRGATELDIRDLEGVTEYEGFEPTDPAVRMFWDVVNAFPTDQKRKLLLFATGTDRIPATGIQNMTFKLSCMGEDSENLPISHTCFNQIGIYKYSSRGKLERKLMMAITWSAGFHVK